MLKIIAIVVLCTALVAIGVGMYFNPHLFTRTRGATVTVGADIKSATTQPVHFIDATSGQALILESGTGVVETSVANKTIGGVASFRYIPLSVIGNATPPRLVQELKTDGTSTVDFGEWVSKPSPSTVPTTINLTVVPTTQPQLIVIPPCGETK